MSRTHKTGLDYFSFDVDFFIDEKVEFVAAKYGSTGELIVVKLLCKIYRNGYFSKWGSDESLIFAKRAGDDIDKDMVDQVVNELLARNFFNQDMFDKFQILTSNGIQRRFLEATKRRKRVEMFKCYIIADTTEHDVDILELNVDINPQRKVKESKGKETKEEKDTFGEFKNVFLEEKELEKLKERFTDYQDKIEKLSQYIENFPKKAAKYKSHYSTILTWARNDNGTGKKESASLSKKDYHKGVGTDGTIL